MNVETAVSSLLIQTDTLVESYMGSGGKTQPIRFPSSTTASMTVIGTIERSMQIPLGRSLRSVMPVVRKAVSLTIPRLMSAMGKLDQSEVDTLVFFKCVALCGIRLWYCR